MTATEEYDGCYLVFDSKGKSFFRAGSAASGMVTRWKERQRSSKLTCDKDRASKLYQAYPSIECDQDSLPDNDVIMGRFDQLE